MKYGTFFEIDDGFYIDLQYVVGFELREFESKYYWDFTCSYEIKRSQSKLFDSRENANRWLESIMKNGG